MIDGKQTHDKTHNEENSPLPYVTGCIYQLLMA